MSMDKQNELLDFVKANIDEIIRLSGFDFMDPENTPINVMDPKLIWSKEDYFSAYEETAGYDFEAFMADWDKYNPNVVMVGYELDTIFITDQKLPKLFGNTLSANDLIFFGSMVNEDEAFKWESEINGKMLYMVFGIPDPGSN
jgi:hypothetical protein